jgi:hypothetical protein
MAYCRSDTQRGNPLPLCWSHYAEGHILFIIMPNVSKLSVVMLNIVMLSIVMLSVVMLSVITLGVVGPV